MFLLRFDRRKVVMLGFLPAEVKRFENFEKFVFKLVAQRFLERWSVYFKPWSDCPCVELTEIMQICYLQRFCSLLDPEWSSSRTTWSMLDAEWERKGLRFMFDSHKMYLHVKLEQLWREENRHIPSASSAQDQPMRERRGWGEDEREEK